MKRTCVFVSLCIGIAVYTPLPRAHADPVGSPERARALYTAALQELDASGPARACPMFEEVTRIAPDSIGGWMMLGECRKRQGKLASAFRAYTQATGVARRLGDNTRSEKAAQMAASLEPKVAKIVLNPSIELRHSPGFEVKLNGQVLAPDSLGVPIPVDVGEQRIEVQANGKKPLELRRQVDVDGTVFRVSLSDTLSSKSKALPGSPQIRKPVQWSCPSRTDIPYTVSDEPTLSAVAEKAYCVSKEPSLTKVWNGIHEYNKAAIGKTARVYSGLILCLPEQFTGLGWYATRCISEEKPPASFEPDACGNGVKNAGESCDGADLGGMTCEQAGMGPGKIACRADCTGFNVKNCAGFNGNDTLTSDGDAQQTPEAKGRSFHGWMAEAALGTAIPLLPNTWTHLHKPLGVLGVGARFKLFWFDIAARADFLAGAHGTTFNSTKQEQTILGGGGMLEWGVPFRVGTARVTPGLSTGFLYLKRSITRADVPDEGKEETQSGVMPVAGLFVRPEFRLPKSPKWNVTFEFGSELLFYKLINEGIQANINAKILGGMGYAF